MVKVKICGITNLDDGLNAVRFGADFIGLITEINFSEDSITRRVAAQIIKSIPVRCVVVTYLKDAKRIVELCRSINPAMIQLHNEMTVEEINKINIMLPRIKIIKTIHVSNFQETINKVNYFEDYVDYILLDTKVGKKLGGTGKTHNWLISKKVVELCKRPIFLAGGLTPENVKKAITEVKPFAVDVNSGVKLKARKKDINKLKLFIERAK